MQKIILFIFFYFTFLYFSTAQSMLVSGYVKSNQDGEALIGAIVSDTNQTQLRAVTNEYGFFSFKLPKKEKFFIKISYVGYKDEIIDINFKQDTTLNIQMLERELSEILIFDKQIVSQKKASTHSFQIEDLKKIPTLGGEPDLLRSLQLMPGITNSTEGNSNILVRGGTPDQNLILLDGTPVYNVSHLGGFLSVFNIDALNKVDIYKGAFPARFGGRLSSVLDISMKEGNKKKTSGAYSLGLISSKILLEGPIKKDKSSFLFTARSSYWGVINLFKNKAKSEDYLDYWLYDINAKINTTFRGANLFTSIYTGRDLGANISRTTNKSGSTITSNSNSETNVNWGNITWSTRYSKLLSNNIFAKLLLGYTRYNYNLSANSNNNIFRLTDTINTLIKGKSSYSLSDKFIKAEFDQNKYEKHFFRYGGQIIFHDFLPNSLPDSINNISSIKSKEISAFFEDEWSILKNLNINLGLRATNYAIQRKNFISFEPRVALSWNTSVNHAFKASYSYMQQNIHLLTSGGFGFPNDFWLPATNIAQPERSELYTLGSYSSLNEKFEVSVEAYYKKISNLIEYQANISNLVNIQNWEKSILTGGKGEVYGIEVFLVKKKGKLNGFMGYTFSQNTRQFSEINGNRRYFFDYHRPHDFEIFLNYKVNKKWELNMTWVYQSGRRITVPVGLLPLPDKQGSKLIFGNKNNAAFPDYQRLDFGINKEVKTSKGNLKIWNFSIYNTYNYPNTTFLRINSNAIIDNKGNYLYQNRKIKNVTLFNIIPSFSYTYKF